MGQPKEASKPFSRVMSGVLLSVVACLDGVDRLSSQIVSKDEIARLQFENGRAHMRRGNYEEGLKDFRTVAESYPDSSLADNARLEMSRYYVDVADDPERAVKEADEI